MNFAAPGLGFERTAEAGSVDVAAIGVHLDELQVTRNVENEFGIETAAAALVPTGIDGGVIAAAGGLNDKLLKGTAGRLFRRGIRVLSDRVFDFRVVAAVDFDVADVGGNFEVTSLL